MYSDWFDRLDRRIAGWMDAHGRPLLRITLGLVFVWFGALKIVGMSPAAPLVVQTVTWIDPAIFLPVLGIWEVFIGLGLMVRKLLRVALLLLFLQMPGAMSPILLVPGAVFQHFPFEAWWQVFVLTIEGQYIVKNLVLISAGLVIGGTVRHRRDRSAYARQTTVETRSR